MFQTYVDRKTKTSASAARRSGRGADLPRTETGARFLALQNAGGPSGMNGVRIHYTPVRAAQPGPASGEVVQFAKHISGLQGVSTTEIPVIPSAKPTMIFESMGTSGAVMEHVYEETKKYKGNTVCVFGLNQKQGAGPPLRKAEDRLEKPHNLVNFAFEWTMPAGMARSMYEMPFVEARSEIMAQANRLILNPCDFDTEGERAAVTEPSEDLDNMSANPVYRWIDGDAADDSSDAIDIAYLRGMASFGVEAEIATGAYNWRHESDATATDPGKENYHAFIEKINEQERILRKKYFELMRNELLSPRGDNAYSRGKFYMPESTFMMNWEAHNKVSRPGNIAPDVRGTNKIDPDGDQARESEKLYTASGIGAGGITYREDLHVTKPLKREFAPDGYAASLMGFFRENMAYSRPKLEEALGKLRQSVFGNGWGPIGDDEGFSKAKERCVSELEKFLTKNNNFAEIKRELGR